VTTITFVPGLLSELTKMKEHIMSEQTKKSLLTVDYPAPPFQEQPQQAPGLASKMIP